MLFRSVEAGKKAAAQILALQQQLEALLADGQPRTAEQLQQSVGADSPEAVFWILRHLCANHRGFQAEGDWGQPAALVFRKLGAGS